MRNKSIIRFFFQWCLLLAPFLFVACKPQRPKGVLSTSKMERVLYDYHLAQGMAEAVSLEEGKTPEQIRYEYQQAVFRKHGITEAEFDSSMVFYCSDLTKLNLIYQHVGERLQREADALGVVTGPRDIYAGLTAIGDTANVWSDRSLFVVKPHAMENYQEWQLLCDTSWLPGDDIMWRFAVICLSRSRQPDAFADLVVSYTNDSIRSFVTGISGTSNVELNIKNPKDWMPREINGHLYTPVENDPQKARFVFAVMPALIRFHQPSSVREAWKADTLQTDSLANDTLVVDSLSQSEAENPERRRSPEEIREEQVIDKTIQVTKQKLYQPKPGSRRRTRQLRHSTRK